MARVRIPLNRIKAAHMPPVCIVCGQPVDAHVPKTFTWRPSMLSWGFWFCVFFCQPALLLILAVSFMNTRRATVECPMCERHRRYWAWRGFWTVAPLLVITATVLVLGILVLTRRVPDDVVAYMFIGTAVLLLLWAAGAKVVQRSSLRVDEISRDDITLVGAHHAFADHLRTERREQKSAPDYGWEEYDPYPRRPLGKSAK